MTDYSVYPQIAYIIAARTVHETEWRVLSLIVKPVNRAGLDEAWQAAKDSTPADERAISEFGLFRNRSNWQDTQPRLYKSYIKREGMPACVAGLINRMTADFAGVTA
jgi:hypothetical protein